jgi:predicted porin
MKNYSLSALVAAGLLASAAGTASAADLGGNCCADLEERIAELEATTVRKGNRKVSLTISGWVGEQITFWDDKHESNVYIQGLGQTLSSHFRLAGSAKVSNDVSAGYVMHVEVRSVDSLLGNNQNNDDGGAGLFVLESYWYLKSDHYGKVSVGQQSTVTDNLAMLTDGSGSLVQANWVLFEGAGFFLRNNTLGAAQSTLSWSAGMNCYTVAAALGNQNGAGIGGDCTGAPTNSIKYESPTFMGASVSAAFGEDDFWDVGLKWAGEHSGFKLAFAVGYSENTDFGTNNGSKVSQVQLGGYVQHIATGLFLHGSWLSENVSGAVAGNFGLTAVQAARLNDLDMDNWYIKAGIRQKWLPYGHTVFYGEYASNNDKLSPAALAADITASNVNWWGLGLVQEIDAAAMSMWIKYRNVDGDFTALATTPAATGFVAGKNGVDNLQMVTFGAMISF